MNIYGREIDQRWHVKCAGMSPGSNYNARVNPSILRLCLAKHASLICLFLGFHGDIKMKAEHMIEVSFHCKNRTLLIVVNKTKANVQLTKTNKLLLGRKSVNSRN